MLMDVDETAVPGGVAARLAALKRRQQLLVQDHEPESDPPEAQQQQQQQQWGHHRPYTGQSSAISQQQFDSSSGSLAARLATLKERHNTTSNSAAAAMVAGALPGDFSGADPSSSHQCSADSSIPADLITRLKVLQQRAPGQQQEISTLEQPEDFVQCLKDLLVEQDWRSEPSNAQEDYEAAAALLSHEAAADYDDPGIMMNSSPSCGGRQGSPMCTLPADNNKQTGQQSPQLQQQQQQQQQQQPEPSAHEQHLQQSTVPSDVIPGHVRRLLVLAAQSLSAQHFQEAAQRAAAAKAAAMAAPSPVSNDSSSHSSSLGSFCRETDKVFAAAIVLDHVHQQQWLAALQLCQESDAAGHQQDISNSSGAAAGSGIVVTAQDIQRAYRRLAGLIHPDKFRHPAAESAFKALTQAVEEALAAAGGSSSKGVATGCGDDDGVDDHDDQYAWWSEWERDVSQGWVDGAAAAGGGGASSSSAPTAVDEEQELWDISMQDLVCEVARRQCGVLRPSCPDDAARSPLDRQRRLRVARTVLAARTKQHKQAAAMASGAAGGDVNGGFVAEEYVGDHYESDVAAGYLKRQRV